MQGRRIAKNLDTVYACLDAANEYYYNTFFREVPNRLRSSALTSGSGVAVAYDTFVNFFEFAPVKQQLERDRKSVVSGKSVSVRVDLGGRGFIKNKKTTYK